MRQEATMSTTLRRAAIYARVSTLEQTTENQLREVWRYVQARGWSSQEYVDTGVSGAKDRRPALDRLVTDARRRRFDVVVCWRLDRLGRNLKHLITLLEDFQALGIAFVSLAEGIDATTPAGRLQMHILGAIAEFERARIAERVRLGLARVRAEGRRLGRPPITVDSDQLSAVGGMSVRAAARLIGVSPSTVYRRLTAAKMSEPRPKGKQ
jgi:DNA invertase Pin-like site-specific DNA recombinase